MNQESRILKPFFSGVSKLFITLSWRFLSFLGLDHLLLLNWRHYVSNNFGIGFRNNRLEMGRLEELEIVLPYNSLYDFRRFRLYISNL